MATLSGSIRMAISAAVAVALAPNAAPADVAYAKSGVVYFADASGRVVRSIKPDLPVCNFTVSSDITSLVFVPCNSGDYGGPLYLLNLGDSTLRKISSGRYWRVASDEPAREVYSDPEFSPDGRSLVFAVRNVPVKGAADLVEASGPLAIMDLPTRRVRLVESTLDIQGSGPAFANKPSWSPDGTRILLSFETGFGILSIKGGPIRFLDPDHAGSWSTAFAWVGPGCLAYGFGDDGRIRGVEILHLSPLRTEPASDRFGVSLSGGALITDFQISGDRLLIGTAEEGRLYNVRSHALLTRFPPGARLLGLRRFALPDCK